MPLDYETLRILWWALLGVLLVGFAVMDGFDLGVAIWLPWIAKSNTDRRILINTIGPTWEGNQVWFILGGGAIFAAWPLLYALSFSGFYLAMLVVLLALILRPVGFKYRSKIDNPRWRTAWDWALHIGGLVPALIFGVAVGNVLQGVPFHYDDDLRLFYTGTFFGLLNPFALLCGVLSVVMLAMHGAYFATVKTTGKLQLRAQFAARISTILTIVLFIIGGLWINKINGYQLMQAVAHDGPSNPLYKSVTMQPHAWFNNYKLMPITMVVPLLGILGALLALLLSHFQRFAFVCSGLSVAGIISTVGVSMFPFILPSSTNPDHSLIVWDSSSSHVTLFIMLIATVIFMPIILAYTTWVYRVLGGKVTEKSIQQNQDTAY